MKNRSQTGRRSKSRQVSTDKYCEHHIPDYRMIAAVHFIHLSEVDNFGDEATPIFMG